MSNQVDYLKILSEDREVISYRRKLNSLTGGILATLFLQQVIFRWTHNKCQRFYKFSAPCEHNLYRPGDSWQEELGMTRAEFESARDKVAIRVPKKHVTKSTLLSKPYSDHLIYYWQDNTRLTWYAINLSLLNRKMATVYPIESSTNGLDWMDLLDPLLESSNSKCNNQAIAISGIEQYSYIDNSIEYSQRKQDNIVTSPIQTTTSQSIIGGQGDENNGQGYMTPRQEREHMDQALSNFEHKYGMSSKEFHAKWLTGEFPDTFDGNVWSAMYGAVQGNEQCDIGTQKENVTMIQDKTLEYEKKLVTEREENKKKIAYLKQILNTAQWQKLEVFTLGHNYEVMSVEIHDNLVRVKVLLDWFVYLLNFSSDKISVEKWWTYDSYMSAQNTIATIQDNGQPILTSLEVKAIEDWLGHGMFTVKSVSKGNYLTTVEVMDHGDTVNMRSEQPDNVYTLEIRQLDNKVVEASQQGKVIACKDSGEVKSITTTNVLDNDYQIIPSELMDNQDLMTDDYRRQMQESMVGENMANFSPMRFVDYLHLISTVAHRTTLISQWKRKEPYLKQVAELLFQSKYIDMDELNIVYGWFSKCGLFSEIECTTLAENISRLPSNEAIASFERVTNQAEVSHDHSVDANSMIADNHVGEANKMVNHPPDTDDMMTNANAVIGVDLASGQDKTVVATYKNGVLISTEIYHEGMAQRQLSFIAPSQTDIAPKNEIGFKTGKITATITHSERKPTTAQNSALLGDSSNTTKPTKQTAKVSKPVVAKQPDLSQQFLVKWCEEVLGYQVTSWAMEKKGVKVLLNNGKTYDENYTDMQAHYRYLKQQAFWQAKHLTIQMVMRDLPAWIQAGRPSSQVMSKPQWQVVKDENAGLWDELVTFTGGIKSDGTKVGLKYGRSDGKVAKSLMSKGLLAVLARMTQNGMYAPLLEMTERDMKFAFDKAVKSVVKG